MAYKTFELIYSTLKKYRKHAYVVIFIISAIVTSPDVFSQLMIGVLLIAFFELSVLSVRFTSRVATK